MEETIKYLEEYIGALVIALKAAPKQRKLFYLAGIWFLNNFKKNLIREVIAK